MQWSKIRTLLKELIWQEGPFYAEGAYKPVLWRSKRSTPIRNRVLREMYAVVWNYDRGGWISSTTAAKICRWIRKKYDPVVVGCWELPQFSKYDIENGFLLDLREGDSIEFTVEVPMTYDHPLGPGWGAKILIVFPKVRSVRWLEKKMRPDLNPDGTIDYGDMYWFSVEGDKSHLSGEWGEIEIVSDPVGVTEIDTY